MSDSTTLLSRYSGRPEDERDPLGSRVEPEAWDEGCFGWLRGTRDRSVMLELRRKSGNILAVGYGWLERAEYDPSEGITLHLVGQQIRLQGRNLNREVRPLVRLFEGLTRHRVPWVREATSGECLAAGEEACLIETILW